MLHPFQPVPVRKVGSQRVEVVRRTRRRSRTCPASSRPSRRLRTTARAATRRAGRGPRARPPGERASRVPRSAAAADDPGARPGATPRRGRLPRAPRRCSAASRLRAVRGGEDLDRRPRLRAEVEPAEQSGDDRHRRPFPRARDGAPSCERPAAGAQPKLVPAAPILCGAGTWSRVLVPRRITSCDPSCTIARPCARG